MIINRRTVTNLLIARMNSGIPVDDVVASAIKFLTRSNQMALLPAVIADITRYADQADQAQAHRITFARESDMQTGLPEQILAKYAQGADTTNIIVGYDPALIGGFVLECLDMRYDYSVRGLVEQLRTHYEQAL